MSTGENLRREFSEKDLDDFLEIQAIIDRLPGIDPVQSIADGHAERVAKSGWLVTASINQGYGAAINLFRYELEEATELRDDRVVYRYAEISLAFERFSQTRLLFERPEFIRLLPITEAHNRARALAGTELHTYPIYLGEAETANEDDKGTLTVASPPIINSDFDKTITLSAKDPGDVSRALLFHRVTENWDEFISILSGIGFAIGMSQQSIDQMIKRAEVLLASLTKEEDPED